MRVGGSGVHGGGKRGDGKGGSVRGEEGQRGGRTGRLEVNGRVRDVEMDEDRVVVSGFFILENTRKYNEIPHIVVPIFSTCYRTLRRCLPIAM